MTLSGMGLGKMQWKWKYCGFMFDRFCRFCMATRSEIQDKEECSGTFEPRTKDRRNQQVQKMTAHQKMILRVILSDAERSP
ncbi:hypothetical protein SRHO_G00002070 [Serrasalmus rhombeus]